MNKDAPRDRAVAIQANNANDIPRVLASGSGKIADHIIRLAEQHHIPIHQDSALTELLSRVPQGNQIPSEAFQFIAEVLCFLYQVDAEWREQHPDFKPYFS